MKPWPCQWQKCRNRAVFQASLVIANLHLQQALIASFSFLSVALAVAQTRPNSTSVVERGEDFAVYQRVSAVTNVAGGVTVRTNQFTLLEIVFTTLRTGSGKRAKM